MIVGDVVIVGQNVLDTMLYVDDLKSPERMVYESQHVWNEWARAVMGMIDDPAFWLLNAMCGRKELWLKFSLAKGNHHIHILCATTDLQVSFDFLHRLTGMLGLF